MDSVVSVIISGIVAIGSLGVSLFSAMHNNRYQLKVKKFEILTGDKEDAFKNYIEILNKLFHAIIIEKFRKDNPDELFEWHKEYLKYYSMVMLFANDDTKEKVLELDTYLNELLQTIGEKDYVNSGKTLQEIKEDFGADMGKYDKLYREIIPVLSKDLNTVKEIEFQK